MLACTLNPLKQIVWQLLKFTYQRDVDIIISAHIYSCQEPKYDTFIRRSDR